jgi:hypothetical protein
MQEYGHETRYLWLKTPESNRRLIPDMLPFWHRSGRFLMRMPIGRCWTLRCATDYPCVYGGLADILVAISILLACIDNGAKRCTYTDNNVKNSLDSGNVHAIT